MKASITQIIWFGLASSIGMLAVSGVGPKALLSAADALASSPVGEDAAVAVQNLTGRLTPASTKNESENQSVDESALIALDSMRLASNPIDVVDFESLVVESEPAPRPSVPMLYDLNELAELHTMPATPEPAAGLRFAAAPRFDLAREYNLRCIVLKMVGLDRELRTKLICASEHEHDGSGS